MQEIYFSKPFKFDTLFRHGGCLKEVDLIDSITQHLELLLFTGFGEHFFNRNYGCEVWDLDFELINNINLWEKQVSESLLKTIADNEPRLVELRIDLKRKQTERSNLLAQAFEVRNRLDISVQGKLLQTGDNFTFNTTLLLAPICR